MSLFKDLILKAKNSAIPLIGSYSAIRANAAGDLLRDHAGGSDTIAQIDGAPTDGQLFKWSSGRLAPYTGREVLEADLTLHVRTDGNDSNDGRTDSAGGAFLTTDRLIEELNSIDANGYNVTCQLGNGTYTQPIRLPEVMGCDIPVLQGNLGDASAVTISTSDIVSLDGGNTGGVILADKRSSSWLLKSLTLACSKSTGSYGLLAASYFGLLAFQGIRFGAATSPSSVHLFSYDQGSIIAAGNYSIHGSAGRHYWANANGVLRCQSRTITLTGTPSFSVFAVSDYFGQLIATGNTYTGAATGKRYEAIEQSQIVAIGGSNYFPGTIDGTVDSTSRYI